MKSWQFQEAKSHLNQLVRAAMIDGPQEIFLDGESVVVVISKPEYDKLKKPKQTLIQFMRRSTLLNAKFQVKRDRSLTRKVVVSIP